MNTPDPTFDEIMQRISRVSKNELELSSDEEE